MVRGPQVGDDVSDNVVLAFADDPLGKAAGAVDDVPFPGDEVLVAVAAHRADHSAAVAVMAVVLPHAVAAAGCRKVDAIAVAEPLHHVMDVVVLDQIVAGVIEPLPVVPTPRALHVALPSTAGPLARNCSLSLAGSCADLFPADGASALAVAAGSQTCRPTTQIPVVRSMVNRVVDDAVLAALRGDDGRRAPIELADVMHVIVGDLVAAVDVLGSRPVAGQQDAHAAQLGELVVRNAVLLGVQVQA